MQPFYNPRRLPVKTLCVELTKRDLPVNGSQRVLAARLQESLVTEGRAKTWTIEQFRDEQPEKWVLIFTRVDEEARRLEPDGQIRKRLMAEANRELAELPIEKLRKIALDTQFIPGRKVFSLMRRFSAALAVAPMTFWETQKNAKKPIAVTESEAQFNMYIGAMGIPEHWTEAFVIAEEARDNGQMVLRHIDLPMQKRRHPHQIQV